MKLPQLRQAFPTRQQQTKDMGKDFFFFFKVMFLFVSFSVNKNLRCCEDYRKLLQVSDFEIFSFLGRQTEYKEEIGNAQGENEKMSSQYEKYMGIYKNTHTHKTTFFVIHHNKENREGD